jgi:glycine cleavage system T protein
MPLHYATGAIEEHRMVRRSAGLFDVTHMGRLRISGPGAIPYLDRMVSSSIASLGSGESAYGLLCNERGTVIDDVFVYRRATDLLMVVNAANRERDIDWLGSHMPDSVSLADLSDQSAMLAFQGPNAVTIADRLTKGAASNIRRFQMSTCTVTGRQVEVGRTGYTGEDGVELFVDAQDAVGVWDALLAAAKESGRECGPVGLAARDSLRFEAGFALYGHELSEDVNPVEARLKWACDLESDFIGKDAILKTEIPPTKLATVRMIEKGVPREGYRVLLDGEPIGRVASGMYAPTVDAYCANVFVTPGLAKVGQEMDIEIRDTYRRAVVVKRPLYKPAYR